MNKVDLDIKNVMRHLRDRDVSLGKIRCFKCGTKLRRSDGFNLNFCPKCLKNR